MSLIKMRTKRALGLALMLMVAVTIGFAQQATGSLRGQVKDEFGGVVVGATISVVDQSGAEKTATTNEEGVYAVNGLQPGAYTVRAKATGFAIFEQQNVQVTAARREPLDIKLSVTIEEQKVNVTADQRGLSTESENNADAIVLKGKDLDALPDDPDDLASALQALAGPSVGPNGGQIYIDGFTGGRLPPKEAIREIRVNQNPLNAENDKPGFGRIDILTRPGFDRWRGSASLNFNDRILNARNPFAPTRAPFQQKLYGFTLSGPITAKKSSFFLDFQHRDISDNNVILAQVLDPSLNAVSFNQVVFQPRKFTTFSPRFDYAINQNNTLVLRYTYSHFSLENAGIGSFSLPSRAFNTGNTQHTFQITETAVLNPKVINETRFQFIHTHTFQTGDNSIPAVNVSGAFNGGGAQIGQAANTESRWELQNYMTATWIPNHTFRFGVRLRGVKITDISPNNFGGSFSFAGGFVPQLDASNNIVVGAQPVFISSLDRYRRTILLQQQGFTMAQIIARGGGPTFFSIAGGNPQAEVKQVDFGAFFQDEWRIRPNLTFTYGVRYENQSNISSNLNFAPRVFIAWAPGGKTTGTLGQFGAGQPKFVIRAGFGMFYDRFNESGTLSENRFNGINEPNFTVSSTDVAANGQPIFSTILQNTVFSASGTATNAPSAATLTNLAQPQVIYRVADNLQAPYSMLGAINIERQLPHNFTITGVAFMYRTRHALILRDVNAPLPGTPTVRPNSQFSNIFEWESGGFVNMSQIVIGVRNQLNKVMSIFANYNHGKAVGNTDCFFGNQFNCIPSNSYNINSDIGRLAFFPRHSFILGGTFGIPKLKLSLNPFVVARTGQFFNITTGIDSNGDRLLLERPAFADAQTPACPAGVNPLTCDLRVTRWGNFDIRPKPGQTIIPRNFAEGPGFFSVNLGLSRTFGFGDLPGAKAAQAAASTQGGRGGGAGGINVPRGGGGERGGQGGGGPRGGGGGPGGGGGGGFPGVSAEKRYNITFSVQIQNIFNRSNFAPPVGNLSSPLFGQSTQTLGGFGDSGGASNASANRRITAGLRFTF